MFPTFKTSTVTCLSGQIAHWQKPTRVVSRTGTARPSPLSSASPPPSKRSWNYFSLYLNLSPKILCSCLDLKVWKIRSSSGQPICQSESPARLFRGGQGAQGPSPAWPWGCRHSRRPRAMIKDDGREGAGLVWKPRVPQSRPQMAHPVAVALSLGALIKQNLL